MLVTDASVGRVLGGAQIVQEKNRESFLLSKNVCWCWLRMLLLAEYVPATMLDPKALGTAFQKKNQRSEWNCTSSPSLNNAADYKGGGVASPQASWICGTARIMRARHENPPPPVKGGTGVFFNRHGSPELRILGGFRLSKTPAARQRRLPSFPMSCRRKVLETRKSRIRAYP